GQIRDRRSYVAQAHGLFDDLLGRAFTRRNDQQRHVKLRLVETLAVAENTGVLAEALAMVGGDDQPGLFENSAPVQLVDQLPELLIEIRDAIVISVSDKCHARRRHGSLIKLPPMLNQTALVIVAWLYPETMKPSRQQLIRIMSIEIVQESEKRP